MMHRIYRWLALPLVSVFAAHLLLVAPAPAWAQFFDESLEQDDLFVEDEDIFFESGAGGEGFGESTVDQDLTEGNKFVDESLVPSGSGVTQGGRQYRLTLGRDREMLPLNIVWGAGTGLLIGGWFALIREGDNRDTQRAIGLGIVTGILLGITVGTRSVFNPDAPRPAFGEQRKPASDGPSFSPVLAVVPDQAQIGFRMTF